MQVFDIVRTIIEKIIETLMCLVISTIIRLLISNSSSCVCAIIDIIMIYPWIFYALYLAD